MQKVPKYKELEDFESLVFRVVLHDSVNHRQKILFACRDKTETDLKYSPSLMNGLFRQSVETGLADNTICMNLCSFVQDAT